MKTIFHLLAVMLVLTSTHCAIVPSSSVKLRSKSDGSLSQPIRSVYIEVNAYGEDQKEMYDAAVCGLKKSLLKKGVMVKEDFVGEVDKMSSDSTEAPFRPDAVLVLGKPFRDIWLNPLCVLLVPGFGRPHLEYYPQIRPKYPRIRCLIESPFYIKRQRFLMQLINPTSKRVIWVGEASFLLYDTEYIGGKVARQLTMAGLLAPQKPQ